MTSFVQAVLIGPQWFYIVLAGCIVVVWLAYDVRSVFCRSAWAVLALFFVWVAAANNWHFIPQPEDADYDTPEELAEAWRLWAVYVREGLIISTYAASAVTLGVMAWLIWGAYTQTMRFTILTALNAFVLAISRLGSFMERYVCSTNSPDLGNEFMFYVTGRRAEACGRLFTDVLSIPAGETIGPLFFPFLTVSPLFVILWRTRRRVRSRLQRLANWKG